MKKERFFEALIMGLKKGMGRMSAMRMAVIAVLIFSMSVTTGCGNEADKGNTSIAALQSVTQEVTPSASEAPEATAGVVESTESSTGDAVESTEETEAKVSLVEEIDTDKYMVMSDWILDADYDEPKITVWSLSNDSAYMLSNGASYQGDGSIFLYVPDGVNNVKDISSNVYIEEKEDFYFIQTVYLNLNEENKITCNITYNDDTQDTITVYFTWIEE